MAKARTKTATRKLEKYRSLRHFDKTEEPRGGKATPGHDSFVIQKHAASRLHYDFRLELDGVLLSWAVPKGPSLNPSNRRLAVRVEDHPLDYAGFEGIIPKGEYGGGSVIVWDKGRWHAEEEPHQALEKGHLVFTLDGEKLHGRWHLVRTKNAHGKQWLLFKGKDDQARNADIESEQPNSVLSGKSVEAVGAQPKRVWLPKNLHLTHPDKVLYATPGITKATLIIYYMSVAERMLALMSGRPLMLVRCPNGQGHDCFHQKHAHDTPPVMRRVKIPGEKEPHTYVESLAGLLAMVQLGVLEIHTWGCRADAIERPDQLVFDLDPDEGLPWKKIIQGAKHLREFFAALSLTAFVKTTGGKGLHVVVPMERGLNWAQAKAFAKSVVVQLERKHPELYVTNPLKQARRGKIFLDYLRNARGATAVAPYSTRVRENATISTPIAWSELDHVDPGRFTVLTVPERLMKLGAKAPWCDYGKTRQRITPAVLKKMEHVL